MRWNMLIPVMMVAVASTAVGVLAGPGDAPPDPPTVADQAIDHADDHAGPALTDGIDPQGAPDVSLPDGQPDVLGIPEENTHPCDNVEGCRQVENAGGNMLNLPDPAADGIEAAIEHQAEAQTRAEDATANGVGNGPPAEVPQGPADVPQGPAEVPQGPA